MKLTKQQIEAARPEFEKLIKEMVMSGDIMVPAGWLNTCEATIRHMVRRWTEEQYLHCNVHQCWLVWLAQEERLQTIKGE